MTLADKNLTQLATLTAKLTKAHLSYLASLIREDLAEGVMAWDTPEGKSLTREDIRDLCEALEPSKKESLHEMPLQRLMLPIRARQHEPLQWHLVQALFLGRLQGLA